MSTDFNTYAGAVLGTLTLVMGLGFAAQALVSPKKPAKPGYELPMGDPGHGTGGPVAAATPAEPIAVRLAKADTAKGENVAKQCIACHKFDKGAANGQGPALYGVIGKAMGGAAGFEYSAGMKAVGKPWDFESLDKFLTNPKAFVTGTKMTYAGLSRPEQRADIIAYLNSKSDSPVAIPK